MIRIKKGLHILLYIIDKEESEYEILPRVGKIMPHYSSLLLLDMKIKRETVPRDRDRQDRRGMVEFKLIFYESPFYQMWQEYTGAKVSKEALFCSRKNKNISSYNRINVLNRTQLIINKILFRQRYKIFKWSYRIIEFITFTSFSSIFFIIKANYFSIKN